MLIYVLNAYVKELKREPFHQILCIVFITY